MRAPTAAQLFGHSGLALFTTCSRQNGQRGCLVTRGHGKDTHLIRMYYVGVGRLVNEMDAVRFVNWESQLGYLEVYGSGLHMLNTVGTTAVRGSPEQL